MTQEEYAVNLESLTRGAGEYLTICEQLRMIYDDVYGTDLEETLTPKLVEAFNMGKKMNSRLAHYKRLHGDKSGSAGSNLVRLKDTEERKQMRGMR